MGRANQNKIAKCPYYLAKGKLYINCEGIGNSTRLSSWYDTYKEKEVQFRKMCCYYPNKCPIAEMLDKKYK